MVRNMYFNFLGSVYTQIFIKYTDSLLRIPQIREY